jgi:predicted nucleic acid-binding protein
MAFKVFLDANIILDFLLKRSDYEAAREVIKLGVEKKIQAHITPAIVHIVAYWVTKAYGRQKTKELILLLLEDVKVIDATHEITIEALQSGIYDIEDALQYYTALHSKLNLFISRDKKLQTSALNQLPVYDTSEFLKLM